MLRGGRRMAAPPPARAEAGDAVRHVHALAVLGAGAGHVAGEGEEPHLGEREAPQSLLLVQPSIQPAIQPSI